MECYRMLMYWLTVGLLTIEKWSHGENISIEERSHYMGTVYKRNVSSWKYAHHSVNALGLSPKDEYEDQNFHEILGSMMSISHEDGEEYFPYGMFPYLFAGTNPYQYGHCEAKIFQKEAFQKVTKTSVESVVSVAPFIVYIFLWLYIEFLAILILPLVGFILFRFVALPLGELIGGKSTRACLRRFVIMVEKNRRQWIKWLWPKNRILPPWRFRTPKILRHDNEGSIPWELMEEKELRKLNMQYPERWQLDKRQQKWKNSAKNPDCYAEKWVFKMIRRKLRHRSFYAATDKFKWGESLSTSSSGTSTSEDEQDVQKTGINSMSEESRFDLSLGTGTMQSLSQLHLVHTDISQVTIGAESNNTTVINKQAQVKENPKRKESISTSKRTFAEELHSLKSSHRGIILDQSDKRWPNYAGAVYEKGYDETKVPVKLKGWQYLKMGLGPKKSFETAVKKLKHEKTKLVFKKREIDALARVQKTVSGDGGPSMVKTSPTKITYNLAVLQKMGKKKKRERSKSVPNTSVSVMNIGKRLGPAKSSRRGSFFFKNKKTDNTEEIAPTKRRLSIRKISAADEESTKSNKGHGERRLSFFGFGSQKKNSLQVTPAVEDSKTTSYHQLSEAPSTAQASSQKRPSVKLIIPGPEGSQKTMRPDASDQSLLSVFRGKSNKTTHKTQNVDTKESHHSSSSNTTNHPGKNTNSKDKRSKK